MRKGDGLGDVSGGAQAFERDSVREPVDGLLTLPSKNVTKSLIEAAQFANTVDGYASEGDGPDTITPP